MILIIPDAAIILVYFFILTESIIFWIFKRREYERAYIPLLLNIFCLILVFFIMPPIYTGKMYHKRLYHLTAKNNNCSCNLYADYYLAASGFMATDLDAVYLTDLKNFRVYIGTYDEGDEHIAIECNGDEIKTIKTSTENISIYWTDAIIIETKKFSLKQLKSDGHFD